MLRIIFFWSRNSEMHIRWSVKHEYCRLSSYMKRLFEAMLDKLLDYAPLCPFNLQRYVMLLSVLTQKKSTQSLATSPLCRFQWRHVSAQIKVRPHLKGHTKFSVSLTAMTCFFLRSIVYLKRCINSGTFSIAITLVHRYRFKGLP